MACIIQKRLLGYEICLMEKEGTLLYYDPIVLIRKNGYTELYNMMTHAHEIGDVIKRDITRHAVYDYIEDNIDHENII